jgi:hypothetical protein
MSSPLMVIKQVESQLKKIIMGSQGAPEFLHTIKAYINKLALFIALINKEDITKEILEGLSDDYKELMHVV